VFQRTQGFPLSLHYRFLRSQPTIAFGIQQLLKNFVSDAGWNTVHQQHHSRSSSRFIHTRYVQWLPGRCLQFGKRVKVGPAPRLLAVYVLVRGYDHLQGERIHSSSGRPLLYQAAPYHLTQSTKGIFARPVAVQSFSPDIQERSPSTSRTLDRGVYKPVRFPRRTNNTTAASAAETSATIVRESTGHPLCSTARRFETW